MPSTPFKDLQDIFKACDRANIKYKALPGISKVISGKTFFSQMRDVKPDELLGRPAVSFEDQNNPLTNELTDKTILVTGAGGSRPIPERRPWGQDRQTDTGPGAGNRCTGMSTHAGAIPSAEKRPSHRQVISAG